MRFYLAIVIFHLCALWRLCACLPEATPGDSGNSELQAKIAKLQADNAKLHAKNAKLGDIVVELKYDLGDAVQQRAQVCELRERAVFDIPSNASLPSNGAKCAGDKQDQSRLIGTMACDSVPPKKHLKYRHAPEKCLDNLSGGGYWICNANAKGECCSFSEVRAIRRQAIVVVPGRHSTMGWAKTCQGVVTKGAVAHPNMATFNVGVLALKRIKCNKEDPPKCEVFKTAVCISVPKDECPSGTIVTEDICRMFKDSQENRATHAELKNFADHVSKNAWVNAGTSTATLKEGWNCTGNDATIAEGWVRAY